MTDDQVSNASNDGSNETTKGRMSVFGKIFKWLLAKTGTIIAILVVLGASSLRFVDPEIIERARLGVFDAYNRMEPRTPPKNSPVVIVDIDEKTLAEVGQFPWPRTVVAKLVAALRDQGAVVVGFDAVFAEADKTSPANIANIIEGASEETLADLRSLQSNDEILADTLRTMRTVLGQAGTKTPSVKKPSAAAFTTTFKGAKATQGLKIADPSAYIYRQPTLIANLDILEEAATGHGVFSVEEEVDGVVRRFPVVTEIEGVIKPALSLQMLHTAFGGNSLFLTMNQGGIMDVRLQTPRGPFILPTDGKGRVWVYFAEPDIFNTPNNDGRMYVSATDIIHDRVPGRLKGKLAIIGTSAVGLLDIRNTPISPRLPGVEVHANVLETVMENNYLKYPLEMRGFELIMILIAGFMMIILIPYLGPFWTLGGLVIGVAGLAGLSWYLFSQERLLLDVTFASATTFTTFFVLAFSNYIRDAAEKRQVRSAFGQYLSPALVEQLAENPDQLTLGGEMKTMSLLFCDVRGFTTISETFKDNPQGLTQLINRLLTPLTNEILARNGTIDKYMGDCIMAFWNAPLEDDEQELHAVQSAHAMFKSLDELNLVREEECKINETKYLPLKVGIGINTGECVVGNMGSEQRFDYSVLGDAVNLAARLEGQSKSYGVDIVLGPDTADKVKDSHAVLELDLIAVKGKTEAVRIFTTLGALDEIGESEFTTFKQSYDQMLLDYRRQKWDVAAKTFNQLRGGVNGKMDDYFDMLVDRIDMYKEDPPAADWDGVFVATTK